MHLLILGGTGFIGPHQVAYALRRGHHVTLFNRGWSCPSTWWKFGVAEVVADHAAWVEIRVGTASLVGGVSSAIGSVCM